ncbi:MAG: hypothetical protein HY918_01955 [Candidatus Doudnabacteria bacterium]|nr:hypothetical protein [Candidatus Doudnabacteria bacterium]
MIIETDELCPDCGGTGIGVCPLCRGDGKDSQGLMECSCLWSTEVTKCPSCGGTGKKVPPTKD